MLRAGYAKVYVPDAAVIHSHEYSPVAVAAPELRRGPRGAEVYGVRGAGGPRARARKRARTGSSARPVAGPASSGASRAAPRRACRGVALGCCHHLRARPAGARSLGAPSPSACLSWLGRRDCRSSAASERRAVLGYPLVHANSSRRRRAAAGGGRAVGEQDVHRPRGAACTRSRSARCILGAGSATSTFEALDNISFAVAAGRVLRDRRAQRQRQEHAAEVHGRDLPGRRRHLVPRPAIDVHRARRRLQPGHGGARQRRDERDHARAVSAGGAQALRQRDRVRRASGVQGPQAQELLLRDARPAGVLGRDPGGRRHPA